MDNINIEQKTDYNEEPVFYCKNCMSLGIKSVAIDSGLDYCNECGSTDIGQMDIEEWVRLYKEKHGFNFIEKDTIYGSK